MVEIVKKHIVHSIKKNVGNVQLNYMMKLFSNNPHHGKNVQSVSYGCRHSTWVGNIKHVERENKRVEVSDAHAIHMLACYYYEGDRGLPLDHAKALELWHRAGELGNAKYYYNIGVAYSDGRGVERDEKKSTYYYELAAIGGDEHARHNLEAVQRVMQENIIGH